MTRYIKKALLGICAMVVWFALCTMMLTIWLGHPAEQPVNGIAYMETIGGGD